MLAARWVISSLHLQVLLNFRYIITIHNGIISLTHFPANLAMRNSKSKSSKARSCDSERRNWENIFNWLVRTLRNKQNQLQSLATEHKFLQDRLRMQHEAWASDIRFHKDEISLMNGILEYAEKKRLMEAEKADLMLGFKDREVSIFKWILEGTEDDFADFKACLELNSCKSSKGTIDSEKKSTWNNAEEERSSKKVQDELRRLKGECEKLALEKNSEVSVLLAEKKFVWNQYNIMENDYINKLRAKQAEIEKANEKIKSLISSVEQLQSESDKKDCTISQLESKLAHMEAETKRLNEGMKASNSGIVQSSRSRRNCTSKKEICTPDAPGPSNLSEKVNKSLKRKESPVVTTSETPKLFSSSFKVPKLKSSSRFR